MVNMPKPGLEVPWLPAPRGIDHTWMPLKVYNARLKALRDLKGRTSARLVLMGDSLTEGWATTGLKTWQRLWEPQATACLGIGGDQTQNLLWRLRNGEVADMSPRVVVLLIGINNIWWGGHTPEDTAQGVGAVAKELLQLLPNSRVVVHCLLPASRTQTDDLRLRIAACNEFIKNWCAREQLSDNRLSSLDLGHLFLNPAGGIDAKMMADYLHLTSEAYDLWGQALWDKIETLMAAGS